MPKEHKPKPKERVHLGKALIALGGAAAIGSIPNDASGGDSPLTKLNYAAQAAQDDNWWDPNTGAAANVAMASEGMAGNVLSVDGAVIIGGSWVLWELVKHSGVGHRTTFKTRHHAIGI